MRIHAGLQHPGRGDVPVLIPLPAQHPVQRGQQVGAVVVVRGFVAVVRDAHLQLVAQVGDVFKEGGAGQAYFAGKFGRGACPADMDQMVDVDQFL